MLRIVTVATAAIVLVLARSFTSDQPRNADSAALTRLLLSDMSKPSEAIPQGVPRSYDWGNHPRVRPLTPMLSFTAFTAWGQLYQCAGTSPSPNDRVALQDLQSWVFLRSSKRWLRSQSSSDLQGGAFAEDYATPPVAARYVAHGPAGTFVELRPGYNFHFWPDSGRAALRTSDVVAIVVTLRARLALGDPQKWPPPCFVLSVGGDLWRSADALPTGQNAGDVAIGRFKRVESHWRLFTMSTATARLLKHFPLPLRTSAAEDH